MTNQDRLYSATRPIASHLHVISEDEPMTTNERKQQLIQAGRKRSHERRRAAEEAETAAQAGRLKWLEDWAAAEGIDVGPIDHLLLELVSRSPSACADIADIIAKGGPVHPEPPSGVQHA